jgi:hypothetical protein
MPETDAYEMINWIPQQIGIRMRKGYAQWTDDALADEIKSLLNYFPNTASVSSAINYAEVPTAIPGEMFAATDNGIYDVSTPGAVPVLGIALSGTAEAGRVYQANFANIAGTFLLACSEMDGYHTYDGTNWLKVTMGAGANQVNNVDPADLCFVTLWKRKAWFVEKDTSSVWYLATDSLYGNATELDLGSLLKKGGAIAWIATWTIDAGEGIDDMLVICSENGEVLIYRGTDPSSASTFGLVGCWEIGDVPKGRSGFCYMGGDLLVISSLGIMPMSYITRGGAALLAASQKEYTSKISPTFNRQLSESFNQFGWRMDVIAREQLLLVSTPTSIPNQFAMNIPNGAWTTLQGLEITAFRVVGGWGFFGDTGGNVHVAFAGYTDGQLLDGTPGQPIEGTLMPAFNSFGQSSQMKHFLMCRLNFLASSTPAIRAAMNVDFNGQITFSSPTLPNTGEAVSVWDSGVWDGSTWGGDPPAYAIWVNTPGVGYYGSLALLTASSAELILVSIDYMMELGGALG